jgi:hypothetical protein
VSRARGEPRRRASANGKRRSLLVFTEGLRTEPGYLRHWHRLHRERAIVAIDPFHGQPLQLVEQAAARKAADLRVARRGHGAAYDEYWCVFDVDEHPHIVRALQLAEAREINIALSNPCVELWFVLHFQDQHASVHRADAQRTSADLLGCGKILAPAALDHLVAYYGDARQRAWHLDKKHALDGSPARSSPASDVWRLIDRIRPPALRSFSVPSAERAAHGTVQADGS